MSCIVVYTTTSSNGKMFSLSTVAQGAGVNIYVVDSGFNVDHKVFENRARTLFGKGDPHEHGTHCAGTAAGNFTGIARKATVYSVKVCDSQGLCPKSKLLGGKENLSFPSSFPQTPSVMSTLSLTGILDRHIAFMTLVLPCF